MINNPDEQQPIFSHVEPVLVVEDVSKTLRYWQEVLGFPNQWVYGDPPVHGGVSWHGAFLQFHQDPKPVTGSYVWIRVQNIDALYKLHRERNAEIVDELQHRPWGLDEDIVKDLNGYYIVFSGHMADRQRSGTFPRNVKIVERKPTVEEFVALRKSVGWYSPIDTTPGLLATHLAVPVYGVIAVDTDTNETIGCALIMSDNASFYYVKDVLVKKEWQKRRIGTALMRTLTDWIDQNGIPKSLVGLYTGENLEGFYQQFGFGKAFGMVKQV